MKLNCSIVPLGDIGCHIIIGFTLALSFSFMFSSIIGLVVGFAAGVLKEAYDEFDYGGGDFFDLFATMFGTTMGIFTYGLIIAFLY